MALVLSDYEQPLQIFATEQYMYKIIYSIKLSNENIIIIMNISNVSYTWKRLGPLRVPCAHNEWGRARYLVRGAIKL